MISFSVGEVELIDTQIQCINQHDIIVAGLLNVDTHQSTQLMMNFFALTLDSVAKMKTNCCCPCFGRHRKQGGEGGSSFVGKF